MIQLKQGEKMTINLQEKNLTEQEKLGVERLLESQNPDITDDLEQIWYLLNKTWQDMGCDNKKLDWDKIAQFYAHPVWLLNGLFIETHDLSMQIRKSIALYIAQQGFKRICDYGGGFGTLAREIAQICPDIEIDIYEPFPSEYGKKCIANFTNICFVSELKKDYYDCLISTDVLEHVIEIDIYEPFPSEYGKKCIANFTNICFVSELKKDYYDCLISTDVLEHVDNVLETFNTMLESLQVGGKALIGNCFYPVIDCHLPKHFHFRYTFKHIATLMGVTYIGNIQGAEYVQIYHKSKSTQASLAVKLAGGGSRCLFPLLNMVRFVLRPCVRLFRKLKK